MAYVLKQPKPGQRVVRTQDGAMGKVMRLEDNGQTLIVDIGTGRELRWRKVGLRIVSDAVQPRGQDLPPNRHVDWTRLADEGMSHREIAAKLGLSYHTVKAAIKRVREAEREAKLAEKLR